MRMDEKDLGRVPSEPGSREPSPAVSAASGFDPSRFVAELRRMARKADRKHTNLMAPIYSLALEMIANAAEKAIIRDSDGRGEAGVTLSGFIADESAGPRASPNAPPRERERVRVILDCDWGELQTALDVVIEARPSFDGQPDRPRWGWTWIRDGKHPFWVCRTKTGYSATALTSDSDGNPEGGDRRAPGEA